uniref:Uncharacterized protein n=1 Tax=Nonomuraea gerenzanensis TaxID=93944 RepID=A0A1M4E5L2_9ACTN|nr:hypothetical protein BN4615_P3606 [Nonomuraea gerenzanensis]
MQSPGLPARAVHGGTRQRGAVALASAARGRPRCRPLARPRCAPPRSRSAVTPAPHPPQERDPTILYSL